VPRSTARKLLIESIPSGYFCLENLLVYHYRRLKSDRLLVSSPMTHSNFALGVQRWLETRVGILDRAYVIDTKGRIESDGPSYPTQISPSRLAARGALQAPLIKDSESSSKPAAASGRKF
jgi:hypothetical protein